MTQDTFTPPYMNESIDTIKYELKQAFEKILDRIFNEKTTTDTDLRDIERSLWVAIIALGQLILSYLLAQRCRREAERFLQKEELKVNGKTVMYRFDRDYWAELRTTFGVIIFPWFALRVHSGGAWVTHTPARAVIAYHRHCRSSPLCLEWETRLGIDHPFRMAQKELEFYTHGALSIEDTTIL